MRRLSRVWLVGLALASVLAGSAFGISSALASGGTSTTSTTSAWPPSPGALAGRLGNLPAQMQKRLKDAQTRIAQLRGQMQSLGIAGPAVHEVEVVPSGNGGFETVTVDSGTLSSVSGQTLTIDETWDGHSYKTVSITVPSGSSVTRDFKSASLSDLKTGDRVRVMQSASGDRVIAWDSANAPGGRLLSGKLPAPPVP